jgi:sortase A
LLFHLLVIGSLQHSAAQARAFDDFRAQLAQGVAPIGPLDADGNAIALGTPVAFLEIPSIDVEEVIGEGTSPAVLLDGPGHRRDTPLPGQIGTSVVFGRKASFGGPFSAIGQLDPGDPITVTTGQGVFTYKVIGVRLEGMPVPAPPAVGSSRLTLVTAAGSSFLPSGVLRVDADLEGVAVVGPARLMSSTALPANERVMAGDSHTLWALAMWLQLLILLGVGVVVAWHRWGRAQTWVVFLPPLMLVGLCASGEVTRLLPNLL